MKYSKSDEARRDKGPPVIEKVNFSPDGFVLNFEGKNFRGTSLVQVKGEFLGDKQDNEVIKQFIRKDSLDKRVRKQKEGKICYENLKVRKDEKIAFLECFCRYRGMKVRENIESRKECEERIKNNDGVFGGFTLEEGHKVSINFENVFDFKHGQRRPKEDKGYNLRMIAGGIYDFIITNTYGSTSGRLIIDFKDGSITTDKIADNAVTNEKIKDGAITTDKLKIDGVEEGQFLIFNGTNWAGKTFEGMEYRGAWNIKSDRTQEFGPIGNDVSPKGHYYIVNTPGFTLDSNIEIINCRKNGECEWFAGDWIVSDGRQWQRVTNTGKVTGFKGSKDEKPRIGIIEAKKDDYTWNQIDKSVSKVSDITDVHTRPATEGQILQWDSSEEKWSPTTIKIESKDIVDNTITSEDIADGAITSEKLARGSVKSEQIESGAITTEKLKENSVTTAKIEDGAVTTAKLADDSVTSIKLEDSSIREEKIANGAVTSSKLANDSVVSSKIPANTIVTEKIADGAVTSEKIKDGAITKMKLANGAIVTEKFANGAVTAAKVPDGAISTAKLGNGSITTEKIADANVTKEKIADGAVTTEKLASDSVTADKLPNEVITSSKLANEAVTTEKIANGNVTTAKIADGAVTSAKFAAGSITTVKIPDSGITTNKLANGAVTTLKIADGNVTSNKIADSGITTSKLANGSVTSSKIQSGTIVDSDISTNAAISRSKIAVGTKGHIIVNDASGKLSSKAVLSISEGGTGSTTAEQARINLGVKIGTDVQAYSSRLNDISSMSPSANKFVGVNSGKLELKSSDAVRQEMELGTKSQLVVKTNGNVGVGTTSPSAKLDVNGTVKVRGDLDMSSKRVKNIAEPQQNTDGVPLGWLQTKITNLSSPFYFIQRISLDNFGNGNYVNWSSGGTTAAKSSNADTTVNLSNTEIKILQDGVYSFTFQGLFKDSSDSTQLHELNIQVKVGSGSWQTISKPKTQGNTMFVGDAIAKNTGNGLSVRLKNNSGHKVKLETLQVTMSRIGDL
tara:strand:- start:1509 stop:4571 length:3063 start_codon:yes stop_codon:yes gene_type:complete